MTMKDIERMLRENLQREAPDHREDILAADPQPDKGKLFRIPRRWIGAVGGIAAAVVWSFYRLTSADAALMAKYNSGEITKEECDQALSRKY